eukprot:SAG25_NODE_3359_length_1114_cov_5.661084_1_plen_148_part_00
MQSVHNTGRGRRRSPEAWREAGAAAQREAGAAAQREAGAATWGEAGAAAWREAGATAQREAGAATSEKEAPADALLQPPSSASQHGQQRQLVTAVVAFVASEAGGKKGVSRLPGGSGHSISIGCPTPGCPFHVRLHKNRGCMIQYCE